jgi:hypothetical protein
MSKQSAQESSAADSAHVRPHRYVPSARLPRRLRDGAISEPLMRSMHIMVACVFLTDVIEISKAKAHVVIQTLPLDRSDPRFCIGIGVRRDQWGAQSSNTCVLEQLIKFRGKLCVSVAKNELRLKLMII